MLKNSQILYSPNDGLYVIPALNAHPLFMVAASKTNARCPKFQKPDSKFM